MRKWNVFMAMANAIGIESQVDVDLQNRQKLTDDRRMSKLDRATNSLSQHNLDVTEALRRIRLDTHLSSDDMRAALDEVIAMVSVQPIPNTILKLADSASSNCRRERRASFVKRSVSRCRTRG
jgi:hypothetical protein